MVTTDRGRSLLAAASLAHGLEAPAEDPDAEPLDLTFEVELPADADQPASPDRDSLGPGEDFIAQAAREWGC